jgi:CheY-like chemotaxis protein
LDARRFLESALRTPETNLVPAAIFSDKIMPHFSGFDFLEWVRAQAPLKELPFILLTSVQEPSDKKRAAKLGATEFFEKFPPMHVFAEMFGGKVTSA